MSLCYVTIKAKSLHQRCNILIALCAFFASFLLIGNCIKFFIFLFGINFITLDICFYIQIIPLIGSAFGITLQLCIGIDRLVAVAFPYWYRWRGKFLLFKILIAICCFRATFCACYFYYGSSMHWKSPVMCNSGDPARQPEIHNFTNINTLITYCGEFLCYAMIWFICLHKKTQITEKVKRLVISLSLLMSIGLLCFIGNLIFTQMIMPLLSLNMFTVEYIVTPISVSFFVMAYGSNAPVLYFCSIEYRRAFRNHLFKKAQQATPVVNTLH
ncbi:hypothetical protein GPALN_010301 [Globodera pallida]|nr:hypothetical protein GPALN_010301 [Globodera pallida]